MKGVYVLHLERPYKHARHYCGVTDNLAVRLTEHGTTSGSPLLLAARHAGIPWHLALFIEGAGERTERWLKDQKRMPRLCPLCSAGVGPIQSPYRQTASTAQVTAAVVARILATGAVPCS